MYRKFFTVSFDDGIEQDKKLIELMKKYNIKGTFNLNGGMFGKKDYVARLGNIGFMEITDSNNIKRRIFKNSEHFRIPEDEIRQVYEGFEVASHAFGHEPLARMKADEINISLEKDKNALSKIVGYEIKGHAYPGGISSKTAAECLEKKGFVYAREAFTSGIFEFPVNPYRYKPTCSHKDKNVFELINKFIAAVPQKDMLFSIWGHSYEFDYLTERCSWNHIEKVFNQISNQKDIVFCTNLEAFDLMNLKEKKL